MATRAAVGCANAGFGVLRGHFNPREIIELTATSGGYNLVSRFLEALAVNPESAQA